MKNTACTYSTHHLCEINPIGSSRELYFADGISVHCAPCSEHLLHVDREKNIEIELSDVRSSWRENAKVDTTARSSRCKGSSLSAPGACQSARQQINIWFPPCFLPIPMGDTYTWHWLIRAPSVSTPLLFWFFDIRSTGTPAPRVRFTSATRREAAGAQWDRLPKKWPRTTNFLIVIR